MVHRGSGTRVSSPGLLPMCEGRGKNELGVTTEGGENCGADLSRAGGNRNLTCGLGAVNPHWSSFPIPPSPPSQSSFLPFRSFLPVLSISFLHPSHPSLPSSPIPFFLIFECIRLTRIPHSQASLPLYYLFSPVYFFLFSLWWGR